MSKAKSAARWTLAVFGLVLFSSAFVTSALQVQTYNAAGRPLPPEWARSYSELVQAAGGGHFCAPAVAECENGDIMVAGSVGYDEWEPPYYSIMRVHPDGSVVWINPGLAGNQFVRFSDIINIGPDRYLLVGERRTYQNGSRTWLLCIDGQGSEVWNQSYGDFGRGALDSVGVACYSGGALIISSTLLGNLSEDICALRVDSVGVPLWNMTYRCPWLEEWVSDAVTASDGSTLVLAGASNYSGSFQIVRCLEPTGAMRWNRTYDEPFLSIASGAGGDYVLASGSSVLCLDESGRQQWRSNVSIRSSRYFYSVVACAGGYFYCTDCYSVQNGRGWYGLFGQSLDNSGAVKWSYVAEGIDALWDLRVLVSRNGGFYLVPDQQPFLVYLPDPPFLTTSTALLAQNGYMATISLAFAINGLVLLYTVFSVAMHPSVRRVGPRELLLNLGLQLTLAILWVGQASTYGPIHAFHSSHTDPARMLLFLVLSPVGIANIVLGALAFAALQVALYPLDQHELQERRRHRRRGVKYLTAACLAFAVLLGFYFLIAPYYYLTLVPFINGAILVGFLPQYLLALRWGDVSVERQSLRPTDPTANRQLIP